ncbi:hypothetical protein PWT90_07937 [Aphanocladium album]|nr:hypothetical protein PWT90_07937 [Aphanocladium album]
MADRHRSYHQAGRPASANPSRSSLPGGIVYQPSYADDSYLTPAGSLYPVTTPRGYSSSTTSSGQPTTTRTYAVTQEPRLHPRTRDHSRTRRSTMDSTTRPPVIITTTQNDRSHNNSVHVTAARNGSPVRDEYRHGDSQYYAVPASTRRSRSSARPYHDEDYTRRRERGDSLLSPHDADAYRQSRPSVTYPSDPRHSTASIDYGEDGYKYTNAGELVRYDLDHSKPSRSNRHESFDRDYYRPRASYASSHKRLDGLRYDPERSYAVPHGRPDGYSGPPPSTRGFDKIKREYALDRDRQALPAAPKPPKPVPHSDVTGNSRDSREIRHSRPVSVSQEPSYRDSSYHGRDDTRDRRSHLHGRSDERAVSENRRPHSMHFHDESVSNRGFGIRTSPDAGMDARRDDRRNDRRDDRRDDQRDDRRDDQRDDRRNRDETRRNEHLQSSEGLPSEPRKDRPLSTAGEGKYPETDRKDSDRDASHGILEAAGVGLGISAAAAGLVASKRDNMPPSRGSNERKEASHDAPSDNSLRHEPEGAGNLSPRVHVGPSEDRRSPLSETTRASEEDPVVHQDNGGASLVKYTTPPASDSEDSGKGRVRRKSRPSNSFNPNDTGDLRQIKEQLAALRVQDKEKDPGDTSAGGIERRDRSASPSRESPVILEPTRGEENYAVGFPVEKKHARVVSPPRDRRDEKPLRGILKQPSARFPEEVNPIREGVAPHKEDKKLKEVPPGARWTKINRKVVNPEALTIGKERFEERDDFVIVLRVLSKEEIQAYAAATQVLRERRRNREDLDRDAERKPDYDDDNDRHHRRHRRHDDNEHGDDADGKPRARDRDLDEGGRSRSARDEGSDSSSEKRWDSDKDDDRVRRSRRRDDPENDIDGRRRGRIAAGDMDRDVDRRRKSRRDDDGERDQHRSDGDRHHR